MPFQWPASRRSRTPPCPQGTPSYRCLQPPDHGEHSLEHPGNVQVRRVQIHRVIGPPEGRERPAAVLPVPEGDVPGDVRELNVHPLRGQLPISAASALLHTRVEKEL